MKLDRIEIDILEQLRCCRFQPGAFEKKLSRDLDPENVSPLQRWYLYKFGFKYRKQIGSTWLAGICENWLAKNPQPMSRKESEKTIRRALKASDTPPSANHIQTEIPL
jgi:hypothetical protein